MRNIGINNFYIELLEIVDNTILFEKEREYISLYDKSKLLNTQFGFTYSHIEEIISMYKHGLTIKEIASTFSHCKKTISKLLKENNISIRDWNNEQRIFINKEDLYNLYVNKFLTTYEIANMYNTSKVTIGKYLVRYDIPVRKAINRKFL